MSPAPTAERTLSRLLAELAAGKSTGILTAVRGKHKRLFCFEKGDLVFAGSNMMEEQFERFLVETRVITRQQLESIPEWDEAAPGRALAGVLSAGLASDQELREAMDGYITRQLQATLQWPDGNFGFTEGKPALEGRITGRVNGTTFILDHVMNYPASLDKVRVRIGPPDIRLESCRESARPTGLNRFHSRLLDRCAQPVHLPDLLEEYAGQEEELYRTVYGMLLTGLLRQAAEETVEEETTQVSREEALAWLRKRDTADHYGILGVGEEASRTDIREAYYALARKMHPDRFRSGPLQDLREEVDRFFTYVTEAYNTLFDPERRAEYDRQRQEAAAAGTRDDRSDASWVARQNLLRGKELAARKKYAEAAGFMENALQQDENNPEILTELGRLLSLNPRRRQEGEQYMLRAAELDPSFVDAYLALAEFYIRTERWKEAEEQCAKAIQWEPQHAEAHRILAGLRKGGSKEGLFGGLFGGN